jgi:hypothetical protein
MTFYFKSCIIPKIFAENAHCSSFIYIGNILFMKKVLTSKKLKKSNFPNTPERLEKQEKRIMGLR